MGVCGDNLKCDKLVGDLGFDAAVNYKDANFRDNLKGDPRWCGCIF